MGGGGTMRAAAAKVVGLGVINGGLRSAQPEIPVAAAVRRGNGPVLAIVSSSEDVETVDSPVQRTYWGMDEWEFAGGEEESVGAGEPTARLVFGGVPTLQETEEATSELKDVLDKAYLSPESPISNSDNLETKDCVLSEATVNSPVPKHAIQAIRLLKETPGAQRVVASFACDPKIWNAFLQNEAVNGFLQSHQTSSSFADKSALADDDSESPESPKLFGGSKSGNRFKDYLEKVRAMMSNLSVFFQNIYSTADDHGKVSSSPFIVDKTVGASLMGLAIMVIMVVILKRS